VRNLFIYIALLGLLISCDPKDPGNTNSGTAQEISLEVKPKINGTQAQVNQYYHLKNGDSILFSRLDFYMQNIGFKDKSGKSSKLDTVFLFSAKNTSNKLFYKSTSLPTTIDTITYLCGLGDLTNSLDPNSYPESHPLSSWKNMYWTMGSKYRFIVIEGNIKTSNGTMIPYSFHTGLTYKYQTNLPVSIVLDVNNPKAYSLNLNIEKIFYPSLGSNVDYTNSETQAHGDAADGPLTDKVALNFSRAFSLE
jgi:hypothetical protein